MLIPERHICDFCKSESPTYTGISIPCFTFCDWTEGRSASKHITFAKFDICADCLEKITYVTADFRGTNPRINPADVRPVVRGKWVWISSTYDRTPCEMRFSCSNCHHEVITNGQNPCENFCPNCGADMREVNNEHID